MADRNNPFGGYTEKNAGRTVQNVTSSMWEPISAGPSLQKDAPVRKSADPKKKNPPKTNNTKSDKRTRSPEKKGADVTRDRISEGGNKKAKASPDKNKKAADNSKKKSSPAADKRKKSPSGAKVPVGSKKREPKGKDTRNPVGSEKWAMERREKKRNRGRVKSNGKADRDYHNGVSRDEMRNGRSEETRRRSKLIAAATVIISLFVAIFILGIYIYQNGATVAKIDVIGESRYKNEKIAEAANIYVGINMLSVREKTVNENVTKALPYIKDVQVEYKLPDTIVVNVTPTQEKLLIAGNTGYICIDGDGKVLSLNKKKLSDGRYLIEGMEEQTAETGVPFVPSENNKEKYKKATEIVAALEATGKFPKGVVNLANPDDVIVVYDSRINIYLGDCARLESQIEAAVNIIGIDEDIINGQTGYIETRYEGQTTFRPGSMQK